MDDADVVQVTAQIGDGALAARNPINGDSVLSRNPLSPVFPIADVATGAQAQKPS